VDELERLLLCPVKLPKTLHLTIAGIPLEWELGGAANFTEDDDSVLAPGEHGKSPERAPPDLSLAMGASKSFGGRRSANSVGRVAPMGWEEPAVRPTTGRFHLKKSVRWPMGT